MKYENKLRIIVIGLALLGLEANAAPGVDTKAAAEVEFPHRSSFPEVAVLGTSELAQRFGDILVVDVRSQYEYDTLRINDAVNIPVTDKRFVDLVKALHTRFTTKPIAFYCNGKTCKKSYDAARMALQAGIRNVYCFDAGIQEWAKTHPELTTLLGRSPIKPGDLITADRFKGHVLSAAEFEARIGAQALVLDIRDTAQRDVALFPFREERAPLDQKQRIDAVIERAKAQNKTLLVYDKTGHQIQWFQYYLEHSGVKQYYFLKGGAEGYFEATLGVKLGLNK